ncbi:MAG: NUDIX hydrolase [Chloroflexota bacterium]
MTEPKLLFRQIAAANPWTTVVSESLEYGSGKLGEYLIVEREPALMIIALIRKDGILHTYLVNQFRYPIAQTIWQFPMGTLERGNDPFTHAAAEFQQETGLVCQKLTLMGEYFVDPGLSRQKCLVFIAESVIEGGQQELEETEFGLVAKCVTLAEFEKLLALGELNDSWGYVGAHFLRKYSEQAKNAIE